MIHYTANLIVLRHGFFAVDTWLNYHIPCFLLINAANLVSSLHSMIVQQVDVTLMAVPTPIRGRGRPTFSLTEGALIGNF